MMISPDISNCQIYSSISPMASIMPQTMAYEPPITETEQLPRSFNLLKEEDQVEYIAIKNRFREEISLSRHGERIDVFISRLKTVRNYINKDSIPSNRWKRMVVCGIMFLDQYEALAINIQQLKILLGKCKSSINGSLQQLGYVAKPSSHDISQELAQQIPLFKEDCLELKKWTIRYGKFPENDSFTRASNKIDRNNTSENNGANNNNDGINPVNIHSNKAPKVRRIIRPQKKQYPKFVNDNNPVGFYNNNNFYIAPFQQPISLSPPQPLSCIVNAPAPPKIPMMGLAITEYQYQPFISTDINHPSMMIPLNYPQVPFQQLQQQQQQQQQQQIRQPEMKVNADDIMKEVRDRFPCPAKCRHKFYDIIYSSSSIQTEA